MIKLIRDVLQITIPESVISQMIQIYIISERCSVFCNSSWFGNRMKEEIG